MRMLREPLVVHPPQRSQWAAIPHPRASQHRDYHTLTPVPGLEGLISINGVHRVLQLQLTIGQSIVHPHIDICIDA